MRSLLPWPTDGSPSAARRQFDTLPPTQRERKKVVQRRVWRVLASLLCSALALVVLTAALVLGARLLEPLTAPSPRRQASPEQPIRPAVTQASNPDPPQAPTPTPPSKLTARLGSRLLHHRNAGAAWLCLTAAPGSVLAAGTEDGTVVLLDPDTGRARRSFLAHPGGVTAVAFGRDGELLATGGRDKLVRLWDTRTGRRVRVLRGHSGTVCGLAFGRQDLLASCSPDGAVHLWDAGSGVRLRTLPRPPKGAHAVAFDPAGRRLAVGSGDGAVHLHHAPRGEPVRLEGHSLAVSALAWAPDGRGLASASLDGSVCLWDVDSPRIRHVLSTHRYWARAVAFSPCGRLLAVGGSDTSVLRGSGDGPVRLYEVTTGRRLHSARAHSRQVLGLAFLDAERLASAGCDRAVNVWALEAR